MEPPAATKNGAVRGAGRAWALGEVEAACAANEKRRDGGPAIDERGGSGPCGG